jgi:Resolvase, N terminal domain
MQTRAMREYAARRGWTIAARRREIDVVLVRRLDRWGRSVTDLLATLQELEHLGAGITTWKTKSDSRSRRSAWLPRSSRRSGKAKPSRLTSCQFGGKPSAPRRPGRLRI